MPSMSRIDPATVQDFIDRLKRIEGQARGIQRMIEEGRECQQVLHQVSAMKAATHSLSTQMLETFALYCVQHPEDFPSADRAIAEMVEMVTRAGR